MIVSAEPNRNTPDHSMCLAPGVHLAWADRRIVALDVLRDRYFRVDRERSLALGAVAQSTAVAEAWQALRTRGLTRGVVCTEEESPWRKALGKSRIELVDLAGVIGACRWASAVLRRERFSDVLRAVTHKRLSSGDSSQVMRAAQTFIVHRPIYPRDYACMFDGLAMLRYLSVRGLRATWMFGVRGAPFSAHCWIEHGGVVLNDDPDAVATYKVIMGV